MYPKLSGALHHQRNALTPDTAVAFKTFSESVFADGALSGKIKDLIAVAVAHVTQCPYCINGHTESALRKGASQQEVMEAIWVAAEIRARGAYAHSNLALETMNRVESKKSRKSS